MGGYIAILAALILGFLAFAIAMAVLNGPDDPSRRIVSHLKRGWLEYEARAAEEREARAREEALKPKPEPEPVPVATGKAESKVKVKAASKVKGKGKGKAEPEPRKLETELRDLDLKGPGVFDHAIVGTSRYQDELAKLAGGRKEESAEVVVVATLVLEDDNPYDHQAVRVDVNGVTVGYLSREEARSYRKQLAAQSASGRPLRCAAKIKGGWFRSKQDQGHFGVRLDLAS